MGSRQSLNKERVSSEQWKCIKILKYSRLLRNKLTGCQMEQFYQVFPDQDDFNRAAIIYDRRYNSPENVVDFKGWNFLNDHSGTCATFKTAKIYTQSIPIRLSDLDQLQEPDALFYLHQSLVGFNNIHAGRGGYVQIIPQMIGFNAEKQLKVWINQNYAKNKPMIQAYFTQTSQEKESIMVKKLFSIFQKMTPQKKWTTYFSNYIRANMKQPFSFSKAKGQLQNYVNWDQDEMHVSNEEVLYSQKKNIREMQSSSSQKPFYSKLLP